MFWATEAKRKLLTRRVEGLNLALLPYQSAKRIRAEVDSLQFQLTELDMDKKTLSEITRVEQENEAKMKAIADKRLSARLKKKSGDASLKPKKKKPAGPPANARRIK